MVNATPQQELRSALTRYASEGRKNPSLRRSINKRLNEIKGTPEYRQYYNEYRQIESGIRESARSRFIERVTQQDEERGEQLREQEIVRRYNVPQSPQPVLSRDEMIEINRRALMTGGITRAEAEAQAISRRRGLGIQVATAVPLTQRLEFRREQPSQTTGDIRAFRPYDEYLGTTRTVDFPKLTAKERRELTTAKPITSAQPISFQVTQQPISGVGLFPSPSYNVFGREIRTPTVEFARLGRFAIEKRAGEAEVRSIRMEEGANILSPSYRKAVSIYGISTPIRAVEKPAESLALVGGFALGSAGLAGLGLSAEQIGFSALSVGSTVGYLQERQQGGTGAKTTGRYIFGLGALGSSYALRRLTRPKTDIKFEIQLKRRSDDIVGVGKGLYRGKEAKAAFYSSKDLSRLYIRQNNLLTRVETRPDIQITQVFKGRKLISETVQPPGRNFFDTQIKQTLVSQNIRVEAIRGGFERSSAVAERYFKTIVKGDNFRLDVRDILKTKAEATGQLTRVTDIYKTGRELKSLEITDPRFVFGKGKYPPEIVNVEPIPGGVRQTVTLQPKVVEAAADIRTSIGEFRLYDAPKNIRLSFPLLKSSKLFALPTPAAVLIPKIEPIAEITPRGPGYIPRDFNFPDISIIPRNTLGVSPFFSFDFNNQFKTLTDRKSKARLFSESRIISNPDTIRESISKISSEPVIDNIIKLDTRASLKSDAKLKAATSNLQIVPLINDINFLDIRPPVPSPTVPPLLPPLGGIELPKFPEPSKKDEEDFFRTGSKQFKRYSSSLTAGLFNIKQPKFKTGGLFTGGELRPLI